MWRPGLMRFYLSLDYRGCAAERPRQVNRYGQQRLGSPARGVPIEASDRTRDAERASTVLTGSEVRNGHAGDVGVAQAGRVVGKQR